MNGLAAFLCGQTETRGLLARVRGGLWRGDRRDVNLPAVPAQHSRRHSGTRAISAWARNPYAAAEPWRRAFVVTSAEHHRFPCGVWIPGSLADRSRPGMTRNRRALSALFFESARARPSSLAPQEIRGTSPQSEGMERRAAHPFGIRLAAERSAKARAPSGAPLAAVSVSGAVLPGGGRRLERRLSVRLWPAFSPTASSH
jgi:hypothetical protein